MTPRGLVWLLLLAGCGDRDAPPLPMCDRAAAAFHLELRDDWRVQSSKDVSADPVSVSTLGYDPSRWYATSVPSTVSGTLAASGQFGDPFVGMGLRNLPSMTYPVGAGFGDYDLDADSAFAAPWWYRTEVTLPGGFVGERVWLRLEGVNYRAEVWLNGRRITDSKQLVGTFRSFEYDVTDAVTACQPNVLAVKVWAQRHDELGWNWVDWNPFPPDKDMGLWRPVVIESSGPVRLRHPYVHPRLPAPDRAELTVSVEAENATGNAVTTTITGEVRDVNSVNTFAQTVTLAAHEKREVLFAPADHAALVIAQPRLWWPVNMGSPELYTLDLRADVGGALSDHATTTFGIREVTSELTDKGYRLFRINGKPLLVRGAGWSPDLFLRWPDARVDDEIAYVADMNLNAVRLEGKLGIDRLYDDCDRKGILVVAGWCCCDHWEQWDHWDAEDHAVARASLRDQILQLRQHPSVLVWLNGSDSTPPPDVEQAYADILVGLDWPNPQLASANSTNTPVLGSTGLKMPGPYMWVPPNYWYVNADRGGAFGFNTETSAGAAIPPVESLKKFLPAEHLWPVDAFWLFHSGSANFVPLDVYQRALDARYGAARSLDDFAEKSQLAAYEGVRAMFEAYGRNRYRATGVIQWMLNNAWPGVIWHLYDYYLKPGGGYFAAKEANRALHVQYSYDDATVVVTSLGAAAPGLTVTATVLALDGSEVVTRTATLDLDADATRVAIALADVTPPTTTYFVDLTLATAAGAIDRNFYWLSTRDDVLDDANADWYHTPTLQDADLTGLQAMALTTLAASAARAADGDDTLVTATVKNSGATIAFFTRLEIAGSADGDEIVPVRWSDNEVTLRPGESRTLTARLAATSAPLTLRGHAWNVAAFAQPIP